MMIEGVLSSIPFEGLLLAVTVEPGLFPQPPGNTDMQAEAQQSKDLSVTSFLDNVVNLSPGFLVVHGSSKVWRTAAHSYSMVDTTVPSFIGRDEFIHETLYIKVAGHIS